MQKLITVFLFLLFPFIATAADLYTSVKSSLYESIGDGLKIQLIDASISNPFILIQASSTEELGNTFHNLSQDLSRQGFHYSYANHVIYHQLIIKLPKESIDGVLDQLIKRLSATVRQYISVDLIVLGNINQQRLLGIINRQFNATQLQFELSDEVNSKEGLIFLSYLDAEQDSLQPMDWMLGLSAALINCDYRNGAGVNFYYQKQLFSCNSYSPNQSLTDKEVANLKDRLYSDIQLSISSPEGFLDYISSFRSERRLELSQSFFNALPSLSIDSILEYHYKKILNVQPESQGNENTLNAVSIYQLPADYRVKTHFEPNNSKVVSFDLVVDSPYACLQLNCSSLAALPYINYSLSDDLHLFSMRYPSEHETTIISELNKVLFIPLSTSNRIAQEHILVTLKGGYLQEAYDESFKLMAKLSLVNVNLNKSRIQVKNKEVLNFHVTKENNSKVSIDLNAVPGGGYWEESELYYFIVASKVKDINSNIQVNKSNTLVSFLITNRVLLKEGSSPVYFDIGFNEQRQDRELLTQMVELVANLPEKLSRDDFVEYKKGVITNLSLLDGDSKATRQISQLYDLDKPNQLLIQRVENLSFDEFKTYLSKSLAFRNITITTNTELDETFRNTLKATLGEP